MTDAVDPNVGNTAGSPLATRNVRRGLNNIVAIFFSLVARAYGQRTLQRIVYRPPQDEVVQVLVKHGARRIADIGCGTGILTCRLAEELRPDALYGIDASPGMLRQAMRHSALVHWRREAAEELSLPDESIDAVVTTTAFHFFNQPAALAEFRRVLRPGGVLAISALNLRSRWSRPVQRLTGVRYSPAAVPSPEQMADLIRAAGFTLSEQHSIHRPWYSRLVPDVLTVAVRS